MTHVSGVSPIFPVPDIQKTAAFYESLGFRAVSYLNLKEKHACLYLGGAEIVLTDSGGRGVKPNRLQYGYGYDAYLYARNPRALYEDFQKKSVTFARPLNETDYGNLEFAIEDADGRWVAFGIKQANEPELTLSALPGAFTVCKPGAAVWQDRPFHFLSRTDSELSLVCPTRDAPPNCEAREDGWRGLRVDGVLEFSLVGILSRLTNALAAAGVAVFAVSTYDTDYLFLKEKDYDRALAALDGAGCIVREET
jgi:hypothetical protein